MSSIANVSNSINSFSSVSNLSSSTKSNNSSNQPKIESSPNKISSNGSELTNKGVQAISSGINSGVNILKTSQQQVSTFTSRVKAETERLVNGVESFSKTDPVSLILLRQNVSGIERGVQALKQSIEFVKKGVGAFEQGVNNGVSLLKQVSGSLEASNQAGFATTQETVNKIQTQADATTKVVNQNLNSAESAISGQINQGLQTIKYGANIIVGDTRKGAELIKTGAETIKRASETISREISQAGKNIEDASNKLNPLIIGITPQLFRKNQDPSPNNQPNNQLNSQPNSQSNKLNPCEPEVINLESPSYSNCEPIATCPEEPLITLEEPIREPEVLLDCPEQPINQQITTSPQPQPTNLDPVKKYDLSTDTPPKINRENLSETDKKVIDTFGLDNFKPGEKRSFSADVIGKIGEGLYGGVGVAEKFTLERDLDDPNKFRVIIEAEPRIEAGFEGKDLGEGVTAKGTAASKITTTLETDLSKRGEATELAGFAAQSIVLTQIPSAVSVPALLLKKISGVNLPGDPVSYIKSHKKSVEITAGTGQELNAKLLSIVGLNATLGQKLATGGKLEFNDDGSYTLTSTLGASAKTDTKALLGKQAIDGSTNLLNIEFNLSVEQTTKLSKEGKPVDSDFTFKLAARGQALNKGADAELSIPAKELFTQISPELATKLSKALSSGNIEEAKKIFQNEIVPNYAIDFNFKTRKFTDNKLGIDLAISKGGTGVDVVVEAEQEIPTSIREAKGRLKSDGNLYLGDQKLDLSFLQKETQKQPQPKLTTAKAPLGITLQKLNRGLFGNLFS